MSEAGQGEGEGEVVSDGGGVELDVESLEVDNDRPSKQRHGREKGSLEKGLESECQNQDAVQLDGWKLGNQPGAEPAPVPAIG